MVKPVLVTIPGVEIAKTGSWGAHTDDGEPWVVTADSIADAVAASHDPRFRVPVLKLGHSDDRFTEPGEDGHPIFGRDGSPAVGRLTNLRASADGRTLLADLTGVPKWLADIAPSAYPSRSTEALNGVVPGTDRTYSMVITGLALLGETAPAIESLADIAQLYGTDTDVETWSAARRVAASFTSPLGAPVATKTAGSARIEDIYKAAEGWAKSQEDVPSEAWPREIYTDYLIMCDWDGRLWKTTWTEQDGEFAFGPAERVQVTYTPLANTVAARAAHAMAHALRYERGWEVKHDQTSRIGASSVDTITQKLREALGVDENADEAAVLSAIEGLKSPAVVPPPPNQQDPIGDQPVILAAPKVITEMTRDNVPVTDLEQIAASLRAEFSTEREALSRQVETLSGQIAARNAAEAAERKTAILTAAARAGKFAPADRAEWEKDYDARPDVTERILARIAPGTAVPVSATGYAGGDETGDETGGDIDAEFDALLKREAI